MLTQGFKRGWLDFTHKTQLSHIREEFLLAEVERDIMCQVFTTKAIVDASVASCLKDPLAMVTKDYDTFLSLQIPYWGAKTNKSTPVDSADWKQVLQDRKKYLDEAKKRLGIKPRDKK